MSFKPLLTALAVSSASLSFSAIIVDHESFMPLGTFYECDGSVRTEGRIVVADTNLDGPLDARLPYKGWDGTIKGRFGLDMTVKMGDGSVRPISFLTDVDYEMTGLDDGVSDQWDIVVKDLPVLTSLDGSFEMRSRPGRPIFGNINFDPVNPNLVGGEVGTNADKRSYTGGRFALDLDFSVDGGKTWDPTTTTMDFRLGSVPEPTSMTCLGLGLAALLRRKK